MKVGDRFGPWKLIKFIAPGGNGLVWQATNVSDGSEVALKILKTTERKSEPFARFRAEVEVNRLIAKRSGVLPLLDYFVPDERSPKSAHAWIAFPIATIIREALGAEPQLADVVAALTEIAGTLAALKQDGIAHRDIKPGNLFKHASAWVPGDFGLAYYPGKEELTAQGKALGPRFFMADEMIRNPEKADPFPADVFSIAKTLWVLAKGDQFPPQGFQPISERGNLLFTYFGEPRAYMLDRLIERATRGDPNERPSMSDFAAELRAWLDGGAKVAERLDLSDIAAELEALAVPGADRARVHQSKLSEAKMFIGNLRERLRVVRELYQSIKALTVSGPTGPELGFPRVELDAELIADESSGLIVHTAGTQHVAIASGFYVDITARGTVYLRLRHGLKRKSTDPQTLWERSAIFPIGSAQAEASIGELFAEFEANAKPALQVLARAIADYERGGR